METLCVKFQNIQTVLGERVAQKQLKTKSFKRLSSDGNLNHFPTHILYDLLQQIFLFQNMISAEIFWWPR